MVLNPHSKNDYDQYNFLNLHQLKMITCHFFVINFAQAGQGKKEDCCGSEAVKENVMFINQNIMLRVLQYVN